MPRYSEDELKKLLRDNQDVKAPEWDTMRKDPVEDELKKFLRDNPGIETKGVNVYPDPKKRKSKYNAVRVVEDGHTFDSIKERNRYLELKRMEQNGEIAHLVLQPRYELVPPFCDSTGKKQRRVEYVADFEYVKEGKLYVEDVKGWITERNPTFRLKKKMFLYKFRDNPRIILVIHD